ncbi:MAG TPA: Gfo/Idh/MocA family oxidoreductase, partial [candidate division Zixibacteria bacterium]|nr:Gfo/Idh/MocA family oxidoreductase [candidate division Zixibacteria bacterium]
MPKQRSLKSAALSRRGFMARSAAVTSAAAAAAALPVHAAGSDMLRIAMVGCGDRGTHDAIVLLQSVPGVELYAMADMFQDRIDASLAELRRRVPGKVNVTKERTFLGFDAYKKVLALGEIDIVMYLTPPGFRPEHVAETVKAGKHMFLEKPGAVDAVGIRALLAASEEADKKRLSIVVGTQQRYAPQYLDVLDLIWSGRIGELRVLKAHWICEMVDWHFHPHRPEWSD